MVYSTVIFFLVFVIPLVVFLVWVMRQEKHRKMAVTGLIVLAILVIGAIVYTYIHPDRPN
jgi:ABC-type Co2+ transport system permease subunit